MSLRTRLSLITAFLTLAGLGLALGLMYVLLERLGLAEIDRELNLQSQTVIQAALLDPTNQLPPDIEEELAQETGVSSTLIYRDGRLTFVSSVLNVPQPLDPEGLGRGVGLASVAGWRVITLSRDGLTVQVGRPLAPLMQSLTRYLEAAMPLALLLGLGAGLTAWLLVGYALRPLERLTQATRRFEEGAEVPLAEGKDEVAALSRSFADLLSGLRQQRLREQRFLSYAAHELRTPIAAFRANLEAAQLKGGVERGQLAIIHREALRLEILAQNLLALSRAESGETRPQPVDLADLAAEAFDRFQPLALERGLELELSADPAPALADPRLLEQALNNLVINALRHAQARRVRLACGSAGGRCWLEVADDGRGMAGQAQEGLGLRVARAAMAASSGTFSVRVEGGTVARLELPSR